MNGCFVCKEGGRLRYTYGNGRYETICERLDMCPDIITENNLEQHRAALRSVDVIFCTWDMVPFSASQLAAYFPSLKAVFYAAGSVQYFARPFMARGIRISSAWQTMARPVAEFTVAMITLANKGALPAMRRYQTESMAESNKPTRLVYPGTYQTAVGILGAGAIGSLVIRMLQAYPVDLMVYDPFISREKMDRLNLTRTYSLEDVFSSCQTISNHIANNPQTVGMLHYGLFARMKKHAAFINTGRGAQVVEADLARALREEPLRQAYLDVTWPEPIAPDSELRQLPNVFITPHIAGYAAQEVNELADSMIEEYDRFSKGLPLAREVTPSMLEHMA